jgi:transposase
MEGIEQLKQDVQEGKIGSDRLVDLIVQLQRLLEMVKQELRAAKERIAELERQIAELQKQPGNTPTAKVDESYSMRAEEQRQEGRDQKKKKRKSKSKKRRGRVRTAEKIKQAERSEEVFPAGVDKSECKWSHTRPVWRLENGRAVLVAYHIYRGPKNQYGKIPGVLGRSEFGMEILIEIAYLVYVVGLSFDKVCQSLSFFQNLHLRKSQADALLRRLARHWEKEFEVLCTLLANSLVVHADETSWSINSVWAFVSEKARILFFGVHKDGDTLKEILDPETFAGLMVSDDAAVYENFTQSQKCWAHLLRKAIKLTLQAPENEEYRTFTDKLLAIYREACRVQRDGRLSDAGRRRKVEALEGEVILLCPAWALESPPLDGLEGDYRRLINEIARLLAAEELFPFVTAPPVQQPNGDHHAVSGTNNEAERTLRDPAKARNTGRTNKTVAGARRQTVLTSVLQSLRLYVARFTLAQVIEEIQHWTEKGRSCFEELMHHLGLVPAEHSVLDRTLPLPDG